MKDELPSDLELLEAARIGDRSAFESLVDRHGRSLFRVAMSLSRNRAEAEDVLQETFLGAYRGMKRFGGRSSVKTWLVKILRRQAFKARGRTNRQRSASTGRWPTQAVDMDSLAARATAHNVETKLDVLQLLKSLSDKYREVVVLREIQGLPLAEIARRLKIPRGTVESRLTRARAELRRRLNRRGKLED